MLGPLLIFLALAGAFSDAAPDPWNPAALLQPADLAQRLKTTTADKPNIIFVGFPILYKGAHIASAALAGPGSKPEGLDALTKAVSTLPRDREIIIYCGCCPMLKCPNIRPAYAALKAAGYKNIRVLELDTNLHTDWVLKNFPVDPKPAQ